MIKLHTKLSQYFFNLVFLTVTKSGWKHHVELEMDISTTTGFPIQHALSADYLYVTGTDHFGHHTGDEPAVQTRDGRAEPTERVLQRDAGRDF